MERIKVAKNFYLDEFIDPVTYFEMEDNGLSLIDKRLFEIVQLLRDKYGKSIAINNWWKPYQDWKIKNPTKTVIEFSNFYTKRGNYQWSGYRSIRCKIGAKLSAHKLGKGIDPKGNEKDFYDIVVKNSKEFYDLGLRRLEDIKITIGWLHMDTETRNVKPNTIRVIGLTSMVREIGV
jgi:hypothetical protein